VGAHLHQAAVIATLAQSQARAPHIQVVAAEVLPIPGLVRIEGDALVMMTTTKSIPNQMTMAL